MSYAKTRKELAAAKRDIASLRPIRVAGMLTSRTPNGVSRRTQNNSTSTQTTTTKFVPRWG